MKVSLKIKLMISYILLSIFLIASLMIVSRNALEREFQNYILNIRKQQSAEIVELIEDEFEQNGKPGHSFLYNLGKAVLSQGVILMVHDELGNELFCMSKVDVVESEIMLEAMKDMMENRYPGFHGEYVEQRYEVSVNDTHYGMVTLGYYGPYYYSAADIHFMDLLCRAFMMSGVAFLMIAGGIGYFIAVRISKPIRKVIDKTKQIEHGNFSDRIVVNTNTTEIAELGHSVNSLAHTLEIQQQLKKRMANDYAHEFRTPLASLQSNLEGMIDGIFVATPERLESLREEVLRLSRMVTNIDKITEMENNNLVLKKELFDLGKLLEQITYTFEHDVQVKNIRMELQTEVCEIIADKDKISQVIVNIISNAVRYTDHNGQIWVTLKNSRDVVHVSVADNGIGIGAEDLPHVFEHLYRTDLSRSHSEGGTGIGLSVVKSIVTAHEGKIEVKSQLAKGSEFIITLMK